MSKAEVCFSPDDVLAYRPNWSEERAQQFLEDNGKYIRDAMSEAGFAAIEALLPNEEKDDFEFEDIEVKNDRFTLTLEYIGEGTSGDYDPSDEKDIRLLRYTLQEKIDGEWQEANDGSACTLLDATERREYLELAAQGMLDYITKHSPADEVNEQALQNLSHADLVGIKAKLRLPKIK